MELDCLAAQAWRQALSQETSLALAMGREAAEVLAAISAAGDECQIVAECARDATRQISEATSIGDSFRLPLTPDRVSATSLFWQTQAAMADAADREGLEASLLPILALHASRVAFQWELIAQLAIRSGLPDVVDLLTKAAEQRRRISQRIEAARAKSSSEGE
jgi:hypothetical protein